MRPTKPVRRSKSREPLEPLPKICKYLEGVKHIDYKDNELLRKFMTERGKILPGRSSATSAKQQRQIKKAIRRARVVGLLA